MVQIPLASSDSPFPGDLRLLGGKAALADSLLAEQANPRAG